MKYKLNDKEYHFVLTDDGGYVYEHRNGTVECLNCTAVEIVRMCLDGRPVDEIIRLLSTEYPEVECERIRAPTFSVSSRRLCEIVRDHPALRQLREFDYTKVKGVCSQCLFSRYCANQCPAYVFNTTGAFDNSLPECQWLYEKGVFPHEFLIRKR